MDGDGRQGLGGVVVALLLLCVSFGDILVPSTRSNSHANTLLTSDAVMPRLQTWWLRVCVQPIRLVCLTIIDLKNN